MTKPAKTSVRDVAINALHTRLKMERDGLKQSLLASVTNLQHELKRAREAIETNDRINAHLIANAAMMTEEIARWNLTRELLPFLEFGQGEDGTP